MVAGPPGRDSPCSREAIAARGLLDPDAVTHLAADRSPSRRWFGWPQAWAVMILELWCRTVLDAPAPSGAPGQPGLRSALPWRVRARGRLLSIMSSWYLGLFDQIRPAPAACPEHA